MGASIDIIGLGPGETAEWAIARVYDGPEHVLFMRGHDLDDVANLPPLPEPPEGSRPPDASWQPEIVDRLEALGGWERSAGGDPFDPDAVVLEPIGQGYRIRVCPGYADFEWIHDTVLHPQQPSNAAILDAFRIGPAVLYQPCGGEWWPIEELDEL